MILLKVLLLTNEFEEESFGGAGTAATGIIYMLDRLGLRQTVIVPRSDWSGPRWFVRGQQIRVLGLPRNSHYFGHLGMVKADVICYEFPELYQVWDVIHIHAINFAPLAYTLAEGITPILYSVYSFLREELEDRKEAELQAQFKIQEELFMRCRRIHLISQSERTYLNVHFPQYLSKAEVLPLGISIPAERWQSGNVNGFLYVGRLLEYKGLEDLMKAMYIVRQSGRQVHLDLVGKGPDDYEAYLRRCLQSMRLGAYVQIHGWKPSSEVRQRMVHATSLVVPSRREAYGMVALEGMALGVPLIASRAGGLAELVTSSSALTFEAGNVKQLADALITALDNPALLRLLTSRGRERASAFEFSRLAPRYLALLDQTRL